MTEQISFDAVLPAGMAVKAEDLGVKKANLKTANMFALAVLAGAFIGIGAIFATTVAAGGMSVKDAAGAARFLNRLPLWHHPPACWPRLFRRTHPGRRWRRRTFTGNTLITMAFASKKVTLAQLLRNWGIFWLRNLVGSVLTAYIVFLGKQYSFGSGAIGLAALNIGEAKTALTFIQAVALGIMCNALVCIGRLDVLQRPHHHR